MNCRTIQLNFGHVGAGPKYRNGRGEMMLKQLWNAIRQNDRIAQLESERDYLDGRLADFERLAEEFVGFVHPDHMCRMRFQHLLNNVEMQEEEE
jgi:hypothetical protein